MIPTCYSELFMNVHTIVHACVYTNAHVHAHTHKLKLKTKITLIFGFWGELCSSVRKSFFLSVLTCCIIYR